MPLKVHLKIKDISDYKNVPESFAASLEIEFCRIGTSFKYSSAQFEESWLTIEVVVEYVTGFDKLRSLEDVADEVSFSFEFSNSWDHWFALQIIKCLMIWCSIQCFKFNSSKAKNCTTRIALFHAFWSKYLASLPTFGNDWRHVT